MIVYNNYSAWTKVYLGSTEFAKVYSSAAQVFPSTTPPTPTGGTKVTITFTSSTISSVTCDQYTVGTLTTGDTSFNGGLSTRGKIDSAIVGDCVNTIDGAFAHSYLMTAVTLPSTITTLGTSAFSQCYILQSINLQDCSGLTTIGNSAFANCSGMTNVSIPNSVTSLGNSAFVNCSGLTSITLPNSISSIGEMTFYKCYSLASVNIPTAVTSIGDDAFQNCRNLSSVVIPSGVTSISTEAFQQCISLTSVTCLATTPPTLGSNVFYQTNQCPIYVPCNAVEAYKNATNWWDYASRIQAIPNSCGFDGKVKMNFKDTLSLIVTQITLDCSSSTTVDTQQIANSINPYTGQGISKNDVTSVTIGSCATVISGNSFQSFSSMTDVDFVQGNLTEIGSNAFDACKSLTSVSIPSGVTTIGYNAFDYCSGMTSVTLPNSVTSIGYNAFNYCTSLTNVTIYATTPPTLGYGTFNNTNNCILYVPSEAVEAYKSASNWTQYASRIQAIPNS